MSSSRMVLTAFVVTILIGTGLLLLPVSRAAESSVSPVDALFTATSAVCVTGLIVLDTGKDFSPFGQTVMEVRSGGPGLRVRDSRGKVYRGWAARAGKGSSWSCSTASSARSSRRSSASCSKGIDGPRSGPPGGSTCI